MTRRKPPNRVPQTTAGGLIGPGRRAYLKAMMSRLWPAAFVAVLFAARPGFAQRALPESREQITLSFAPLVEQAAPAVVNVFTSRLVRQRSVSPLFSDPFFQRFLRFRFAVGGLGRAAEATIVRNDRQQTVTIPREAPPEDPPRNETQLGGRHPLAGATVVNLSPAVAVERGLDSAMTGILVTEVIAGSPAQRIGLRRHDRVVEVNRAHPETVAELRDVLAAPDQQWSLAIRRGDRMLRVTVNG